MSRSISVKFDKDTCRESILGLSVNEYDEAYSYTNKQWRAFFEGLAIADWFPAERVLLAKANYLTSVHVHENNETSLRVTYTMGTNREFTLAIDFLAEDGEEDTTVRFAGRDYNLVLLNDVTEDEALSSDNFFHYIVWYAIWLENEFMHKVLNPAQ